MLNRGIFITLLINILLPQWLLAEQNPQKHLALEAQESAQIVNSIVVQYNTKTHNQLESLDKTTFYAQVNKKLETYTKHHSVSLAYKRPMSGKAHVMQLDRPISVDQAVKLALDIEKHPDVAFAQPDYLNRADFTPNDTYYRRQQAHYFSNARIGLNLPSAWNNSLGKGINVAVIDSGYRPHFDLDSKILPGYDFISSYAICSVEGIQVLRSNDGDKRDADARDPGSATDSPDYSCAFASSWHGTKVAGIIAAETHNRSGIAGVAPGANILPVRVLGLKGLGSTSDIVDGMRWAAGIDVPGVPRNQHPAQVLNLSLSGQRSAPCGDNLYKQAVADILAKGVVIVATAGNLSSSSPSSNPANYRVPGSCTGVISTASINKSGHKANHSLHGTVVDIAAPGEQVFTLSNNGQYGPTTDSFASTFGTSFAAPHVAGVAALMLEVNPRLSPAQVENIIESTARPFPSDCTNCNGIGSGILNAEAAVNRAIELAPPPAVYSIAPIMMFLLDEDE